MHPHRSAKPLLSAHAANRGEIALPRSPITSLPPTTAVPPYSPAPPARLVTTMRAGPAPRRCPGLQLSHTIPVLLHSPAAHPSAHCHRAVQAGSAPTHCPERPASPTVAGLRLRSCPLGKQAHA